MKEAIEKAYGAGYNPEKFNYTFKWEEDMSGATEVYQIDPRKCQLDPLFWQALGKSLGWEKADGVGGKYAQHPNERYAYWKWQWHRFIDHLAEGKDPDEFFKSLIK